MNLLSMIMFYSVAYAVLHTRNTNEMRGCKNPYINSSSCSLFTKEQL